jgi:hypothetical protein
MVGISLMKGLSEKVSDEALNLRLCHGFGVTRSASKMGDAVIL